LIETAGVWSVGKDGPGVRQLQTDRVTDARGL